MSIEVLSGKVFLLITGASRGIGRQIAITFGSLLEEGSHILLLARNLDALQEVAKNIPSNRTVTTLSMDLSKSTKTDFEGKSEFLLSRLSITYHGKGKDNFTFVFYFRAIVDAISRSLKGTATKAFDRVILVHNVATIGNISKFTNEIFNVDTWREYYDVNFFVPVVLNAVVMNMFDNSTNTKKLVINITSLCGIQAYVAMSQYCSVKAAREMYFKVFALENPDVNVLSYSPGPVATDMFQTICREHADPDTKKEFNEIQETKIVLTTEQTVNHLLEVLRAQKYKSADHIDYYDKL